MSIKRWKRRTCIRRVYRFYLREIKVRDACVCGSHKGKKGRRGDRRAGPTKSVRTSVEQRCWDAQTSISRDSTHTGIPAAFTYLCFDLSQINVVEWTQGKRTQKHSQAVSDGFIFYALQDCFIFSSSSFFAFAYSLYLCSVLHWGRSATTIQS